MKIHVIKNSELWTPCCTAIYLWCYLSSKLLCFRHQKSVFARKLSHSCVFFTRFIVLSAMDFYRRCEFRSQFICFFIEKIKIVIIYYILLHI